MVAVADPNPATAQILPAAHSAPVEFLPRNIQANLRTYKKWRVSLCPYCGYSGSIGQVGSRTPGGVVLWIVGIVFILVPLGWIIIAIKVLGRKYELECPNCGQRFIQ